VTTSKPVSRRNFLLTAVVAAEAASASANQETKKVKVGVIGCGSVSGSYLPVMVSSPYIELVSACDLILSRAEQRAKQFKIPHVYPESWLHSESHKCNA
jgi:hypothetical protein